MTALNDKERRRYDRHILLPEVGEEGQRRLKRSRILIVGAGGLGTPAATYLAAAGVGTIGVVDDDVVDESNLQRQILYTTDDLGKSKLESARKRLLDLNPHIDVVLHDDRITSKNARELVAQYDVVLDGSDNFPTRYLVNDACVLEGRPDVYGSIYRFEGQISVFWAEKGPCYRCLYPDPPPPGLVPSCAEGGVLGVLPGVVGTMQATEAIKLLLGIGEPLVGRLLLYDALQLDFQEVRLQRNQDCVVCGENPALTRLIDYEAFCAGPVQMQETIPSITATRLNEQLQSGTGPLVVDVREPGEMAICRIDGSTAIPLGDIPQRFQELPKDRPIVCLCKVGGRSAQATQFLRDQGYEARNLDGGILAWIRDVDQTLATY